MIFGRRADYRAIFASSEETRRHLYGNPEKTGAILSSEEFLSAVSESPHQQRVEMIIRQEALKGDKASLLYMINLLGIFYAHVSENEPNRDRRNQISKSILADRVQFCEKAIGRGMKDQAYYGMSSSVALHQIALSEGPESDVGTLKVLEDIVRFGDTFLTSGYNDRELLQEVKESLDHWRPIAKLAGQVCRP